MPGPPAKRSSARRRRNKPEGPELAKVKAKGPVTLADGEPPRSGRGSSTDSWRAYAVELGHQVPDDATRGDIIALVDEGLPDETAGWHPAAAEWYRALAGSAQSGYYEPSDWATAKVAARLLSSALKLLDEGGRGAATLVERWQMLGTELLTTEGARRRARMEIERVTADGAGEDVADVLDLAGHSSRLRSI